MWSRTTSIAGGKKHFIHLEFSIRMWCVCVYRTDGVNVYTAVVTSPWARRFPVALATVSTLVNFSFTFCLTAIKCFQNSVGLHLVLVHEDI